MTDVNGTTPEVEGESVEGAPEVPVENGGGR